MNTQFGTMCPYKVTLCQEREGCSNCRIYLDRTLSVNSLAELNWKIAMDSLDDAAEASKEARERLEKALQNLNELRRGMKEDADWEIQD